MITYSLFYRKEAKLPNTIGGSAFLKPDNKDIEDAFKKIVKKDLTDKLIEHEAVKFVPEMIKNAFDDKKSEIQ